MITQSSICILRRNYLLPAFIAPTTALHMHCPDASVVSAVEIHFFCASVYPKYYELHLENTMAHSFCAMSVSYTHLDVYKRQNMSSIKPTPKIEVTEANIVIAKRSEQLNSSSSVCVSKQIIDGEKTDNKSGTRKTSKDVC